jgi:hypothetical protein
MNDPHDNREADDAILRRLQATEAEHVRLTADGEPDGCFFIPAKPWKDTGKWVPSWVRRNQPGHTPFAGNGPCAEPWYWGRSYQEAQETATRENAKLGISPVQAAAIILSSVRASRHVGTEADFTS